MILLITRRLLVGLLTLWAASVVVFAGTELLPGDAASAYLGQEKTEEGMAALRAKLGLDKPGPVRYFIWLTNFLKGEMGKFPGVEQAGVWNHYRLGEKHICPRGIYRAHCDTAFFVSWSVVGRLSEQHVG